MAIAHSELIINPDGSIYHLNIKPEQVADTVITVGDPDRVDKVADFFDNIEFTVQKREFKTITGVYKNKRITVLSTGIGTDNIDIVLNELDALVNINFKTRKVNKDLKSLNIIRIGTSGAIQPDIPINSFLISTHAIGFDNMIHFYENEGIQDLEFQKAFMQHTSWSPSKGEPYLVEADASLLQTFTSQEFILGCTATNVGFYGPQGRVLRLQPQDNQLNTKLEKFIYNTLKITNLEMETSGIYSLSKLLGHKAISLNAILANRANGSFSDSPELITKQLIQLALDKIAQL